jgi:FkbM family methyltransferase
MAPSLCNAEVLTIQAYIPDDGIVFDIGANIGLWTNQVLKQKSLTVVHAFEPNDIAANQFQHKYGSSERVRFNKLGMLDEECERELFIMCEDGEGSCLNDRGATKHKFGGDLSLRGTQTIQLTTVDKYCETNGIDHIDFIKIDVEGYEFKVLLGAQNMLGNIDGIQFEFNGSNEEQDCKHTWYDIVELLGDYGFNVGHMTNQKKFIKSPGTFQGQRELHLTPNGLALKKPYSV